MLRRELALIAALVMLLTAGAVPAPANAVTGAPLGATYITVPARTKILVYGTFNACNALSWGVEINATSTVPGGSRPFGCQSPSSTSLLTLGPYSTTTFLRVYFRDDSCGWTYYSDGTPVNHAFTSGTYPITAAFVDGGYQLQGCPFAAQARSASLTNYNFVANIYLQTAPAAPTLAVSPGASTTNFYTASWTPGPGGTGGVGYYLYLNGATYAYVGAMTSFSGALARSYGANTAQVQAVDGTGASSPLSNPVQFVWNIPTALTASTPAGAAIGKTLGINVYLQALGGTQGFVPGAVVEVLLGGSVIGSATTTASGTAIVLTVPVVQPGPNTLVLRTRSMPSGYAAPSNLTRSIVIVGPPPATPSVTVTPASSSTDLFTVGLPAQPTVTRYEYALDGAAYTGAFGGPPTGLVTSTSSYARGVRGTHTIKVRAVDAIGQASPYSAPVSYEYRKGATSLRYQVGFITPLTLVPPPAPPALLTGCDLRDQSTVPFTLPTILVQLRDEAGNPLRGARPVTLTLGSLISTASTSVVDGTAYWTGGLQGRIAPGPATATVTFAGDVGYAGSTLSIPLSVPDGCARFRPPSKPAGLVVSPSVSPVNSFSASWVASQPVPGGAAVARYRFIVDGVVTATVSSGTSYTGSLAPNLGMHTLRVRAEDANGNVSEQSDSVTFEWRQGATHWSASTTVQASCSGGVPVGTFTVRAVLLDQNNRPIAARSVSATGNGAQHWTRVTDTDGSATFAGVTGSSFTVAFSGDTSYQGSTASVTIPAQPPCATPTPVPTPSPTPPPAPSIAPGNPNLTVDIPVR